MGNVYGALVGLYWLEGDFQRLTDQFLTLMDLDQIEYAHWTPAERMSSVGYLRRDHALRCTKFVFVQEGRDYGYSYGGPAPTLGSVVCKRPPWLAQPGNQLWIPEWHPRYQGPMPQGEHRAPPLPPRPAPGRETPRDTAADGRAAPSGAGRAGSSNERPAPGGAREETGRTPGDQGAEAEAIDRHRAQHPYDPQDQDTTILHYIECHMEPQPDPDKCTAIFMLTPMGEESLKRVVPRSRWPQGHGYVKRF